MLDYVKIYREINKISEETSSKELMYLVEKRLLNIIGEGRDVGILIKSGRTGSGYIMF